MSFDPQTERDKKAVAAAQVEKPRLEPKFPWSFISFDPEWFNVLRDPPLPPADSET